MHGNQIDQPLHAWFDFKIPKTTVDPNHIQQAIEDQELSIQPTSKYIFTGKLPAWQLITKSKKGASWEVMTLDFQNNRQTVSINVEPERGKWLLNLLPRIQLHEPVMTLQQIREDYENHGLDDFELFWDNKPVNGLYKAGLWKL
jgi:hypothetical protein